MIVEIQSAKHLFDWNRLWEFNRNPDNHREQGFRQGWQSFSATDYTDLHRFLIIYPYKYHAAKLL